MFPFLSFQVWFGVGWIGFMGHSVSESDVEVREVDFGARATLRTNPFQWTALPARGTGRGRARAGSAPRYTRSCGSAMPSSGAASSSGTALPVCLDPPLVCPSMSMRGAGRAGAPGPLRPAASPSPTAHVRCTSPRRSGSSAGAVLQQVLGTLEWRGVRASPSIAPGCPPPPLFPPPERLETGGGGGAPPPPV